MANRKPITFEEAHDFAREVLKIKGDLGNLREELDKRGCLWAAQSLIEELLVDDIAPLGPEDIAREEAMEKFGESAAQLLEAWKNLRPHLHEQGTPSPVPFQSHLEPLEKWKPLEPLLAELWGRLYGPGNGWPGLIEWHKRTMDKHRSAHREKEGKPRRAFNRPVAGCLYIAVGAILERAFPGNTPNDEHARAPYRWKILEAAADRFPEIVTKYKSETWESKPFQERVKKQGERLKGDTGDFTILAERIQHFPPLFRELYKTNPKATFREINHLQPFVELLCQWGQDRPTEKKQEKAILAALEKAAQDNEAHARELYANRHHPT